MYRGAEADLYLGKWSDRAAVYKVRKPLPYRLPALDLSIRRARTVREAQMIHAARSARVEAPFLYFVGDRDATLVMEHVAGTRLKDAISRGRGEKTEALFRLLGEGVARLHASGIMHGDVTTANVIVRDGGLVFIDFGLAARHLAADGAAHRLYVSHGTRVQVVDTLAAMALAGTGPWVEI